MVNLESLYQELILDHYKNPLNKGLASDSSVSVHHVNPSCGDEVDLNLIVAGQQIVSVTWDGVGCSISQASTSVLSDLVRGKSAPEALRIIEAFSEVMASKGSNGGDPDLLGDAVAFAGVSRYPARIKCALLGWMALKDAMVQAKVIG
ncbi:MAG: SUF system NifU family Fe-S cluster assembly protein [Actinobacteria bacterium]|nr:SUF system NifU family Fe-S cluster assembly protein [Actinomycetota bacterium]